MITFQLSLLLEMQENPLLYSIRNQTALFMGLHLEQKENVK